MLSAPQFTVIAEEEWRVNLGKPCAGKRKVSGGIADGVADPVAFLIDCEDEIGAQIARAWDGDDAVDAAILASAAQADDA